MDIILLHNGLGNQMSQYAFYLSKKKNGIHTSCICLSNDHNGIELDKVFGVECQMGCKKIFLLFILRLLMSNKTGFLIRKVNVLFSKIKIKLITENLDYSFHPSFLSASPYCLAFWVGGWHHPQYYSEISSQIKEAFTFKRSLLDERNICIEKRMREPNSVCLHIRRGDYLTGINYELFGKVCNEQYYQKAIDYIEGKLSDICYYVFSNDMEWAKKILLGKNAVFVDWNRGEESWKDMYLMSKCSNLIIPNSTFSWWAAWLCEHPVNIVCPKLFVYGDEQSDIYLDNWHKIE